MSVCVAQDASKSINCFVATRPIIAPLIVQCRLRKNGPLRTDSRTVPVVACERRAGPTPTAVARPGPRLAACGRLPRLDPELFQSGFSRSSRFSVCFPPNSTFRPHTMAASMASARQALRLSSCVRHFSSTASRPAAEVKRLGVIGAGQMVRSSTFPVASFSCPSFFWFCYLFGLGLLTRE